MLDFGERERRWFSIGTRRYHGDPNMNYQMNRIVAVCGGDPEAVAEAARGIASTEDWIREFISLAEAADAAGDKLRRSAYLRAANFYLSPGDPRKDATYRAYAALVREMSSRDFETGKIDSALVPYEGGFLPVWSMRAASLEEGDRAPAILFHLGYDSLKEEMLPVLELFRDEGMDVWLFEGPGQGAALYDYGICMTHEWEKPVKAVLDHFRLDGVTLVGLSLGGYLAPKAAIGELRIERVVAWGAMYDFFDVVVSRRGKAFELFLKGAIALGARGLLNAAVRAKMARDSYARWGVEQGMSVLGADDPFDYFRSLRRYNLRDAASRLRQDFLLLGGAEDHFVPLEDFYRQARAMTGARSMTARLFTAAEGAENHAQFGNVPLAVRCIAAWIRERSAS